MRSTPAPQPAPGDPRFTAQQTAPTPLPLQPVSRSSRVVGISLRLALLLSASVSSHALTLGTLEASLATNVLSEAAGANGLRVVVRLNPPPSQSVPIQITVQDVTEIAAHEAVTYPAGTNSVAFDLAPVNDGEVDGDQQVEVTFSASGYRPKTVVITVTDDDTAGGGTVGGHLFGSVPVGSFRVTDTLVVDSGRELTLLPGTALLFPPSLGLTVDGSLVADGASAATAIRLGSTQVAPTNGAWAGVLLRASDQPRSWLHYVNVSHASNCVAIVPKAANPNVSIQNCQLDHAWANGLLLQSQVAVFIATNEIVIASNHISACRSNGILVRAIAGGCGNTSISAPILHNEIVDNGGAGIELYFGWASTGCTARRSATVDARVSGNVIRGNAYGIYSLARNSGESIARLWVRIENSLIAQNSRSGLWFGGTALAEIRPQVINCTIALNSHGLTVSTNIDDGFTFVNNIVARSQVGIEATARFGDVAVHGLTNNLVYGNTDTFLNFPPAFGAATGTGVDGVPRDSAGNLLIDPRLSEADFRLTAGSPAINAGAPELAPAVDFDGEGRDARPDLGFDEWSSSNALVLAIASRAGGGFELIASGASTTEPGTLELQSSPDLLSWTTESTITPEPNTGSARIPVPGAGIGTRFFRLKATP